MPSTNSKPAPPANAPNQRSTTPNQPRLAEPPGSPGSERMVLTPEDRAPARLPGSTWVESGPVRFEEPPEGTLQLLPGRLEIQSGEGAPEEVRFVRVPGTEPEITLGREEGPAYRHIQLRSPTVSRLHARLRFREGRWSVLNESSTNPTILNGESLGSPDQVVALRDGDRLELGQVSFVFRQPDIRDRLSLRSSWYTDHGRRPSNQDATAVRTFPDGRELAVVCDGMGSSDAGGVASHEALGALVEALARGERLPEAVRTANSAVVRRGGSGTETAGMGTTMVALVREGDAYEIANVGDSRAYRIDRKGIRQITRDHSFVAEVVEDGRMSAEEAARSPWRNAITRHLGAQADVEVDLFGAFSTGESHLVVLCSDGIHSVMSDEQIEATARATPQVQDAARAVGEEALRRGSEDNVTVVVLEFGGGLSGR